MKRSIGLVMLTVLFLFTKPNGLGGQEVKQALMAELEKKGIPGISLTVLHKKNQETMVLGMADPDLGLPLEPRHRMLSGSIGKTFFAALIMQLVEKGILDLEAKAASYLSHLTWYKRLPNARDITLKHLMNHTSGIPEYVYANELWQEIKNSPARHWTVADRLAYILDQEALFPAGEGWSYADANYIILGAIVEEVSGKNSYELVQERILNPCSLRYTQAAVQPNLPNLTPAYSGRLFGQLFGEKIAEEGQYGLNPQFEWTGGGFITHSADLARWAKCFYEGEVFSRASQKLVFSPVNRQTGETNGLTGYGLGTEIFATRYGLAYGHTGFMPGYLSLMAYLPDYDLALAFQVNTDPYSSKVKEHFSVFEILELILPYYIQRNKAYKKKTKLYMVRHAEKENDGSRNPDLNAAGKKRAEHLASLLGNKNIAAIYSTPFRRTRQTAQPLADELGLPIDSYPPTEMTHVFDFIANHQGKEILVVGHSNTIPAMANWLLTEEKISPLGEKDYGDLFLLTHKKGKTRLTRKRF